MTQTVHDTTTIRYICRVGASTGRLHHVASAERSSVCLTTVTISCSAKARVPKPCGATPAHSRREQRRERNGGRRAAVRLGLFEGLQPRIEAGRCQLHREVSPRRGNLEKLGPEWPHQSLLRDRPRQVCAAAAMQPAARQVRRSQPGAFDYSIHV